MGWFRCRRVAVGIDADGSAMVAGAAVERDGVRGGAAGWRQDLNRRGGIGRGETQSRGDSADFAGHGGVGDCAESHRTLGRGGDGIAGNVDGENGVLAGAGDVDAIGFHAVVIGEEDSLGAGGAVALSAVARLSSPVWTAVGA
jgi:hypothetical protein